MPGYEVSHLCWFWLSNLFKMIFQKGMPSNDQLERTRPWQLSIECSINRFYPRQGGTLRGDHQMTSLQGDPCPPPVITVSGRDNQMLITITLAIAYNPSLIRQVDWTPQPLFSHWPHPDAELWRLRSHPENPQWRKSPGETLASETTKDNCCNWNSPPTSPPRLCGNPY